MRKYLLTCFILLLTVPAMAQQKKTTINLVQSSKSVTTKVNGADLYTVYNCTFKQKYSTLRADSAYVHLDQNTFDAFGHVVINQGDTLHIYSDKLNYNDNTKIAILTDNVKMVDKDATLTTNLFNYNTATKYGTYVNGGKLVNKDNVLISKNGYYFAQSRDAYFRYDVVLTTPDAIIKTDTLRYNSGSRIAYFYGPTNMYGKKDKDTLYTENGTYNTKTEQAFFGKKNRYSQGTKSLKGDSLFYDRAKGYGKAIKNMTFEDKEQNMIGKGDLGEYFKIGERVVLTQKAYIILVTEDKDTTKAADTVAKKIPDTPAKGKAITQTTVKNGIPNAIPVDQAIKAAGAIPDKDKTRQKADSLAKAIAAMPAVKNTAPVVTDKLKDSVKKAVLNNPALPPVTTKPGAVLSSAKPTAPPAKNTKPAAKDTKPTLTDTAKLAKKDTTIRVKRDSMFIGADTLETEMVTYKVLKTLQEQRRLAGIKDTTIKLRKPFEPYKKIPQFLTLEMPRLEGYRPDFAHRPLFTVVKPAPDTTQKKVVKIEPPKEVKKKPETDSLKTTKQAKVDVPLKPVKPELSDTARVRMVSAHHNVKIFKSDLQGKSDSLFYSSADSIIRSFVKPMYWTQGAQLSGDTIYLQLKNKKLDNMDVFPSAFIVHIEENDSTHFNQVAGKRLRGYFKDSKLSRVDVNGNAETIYFNRNKKKVVSEMQRSLSSSITMIMKKGEMANTAFRLKADHKVYPIAKVKEDDKVLKGFIWKPKDRPANKAAVTNPVKEIPPAKVTKPVKLPGKPGAKDTTKAGPPALKLPATVKKDSTGKATPPVVKPGAPAKKDSTVKGISPAVMPTTPVRKDSTNKTTPPVAKPVAPAKRDSAKMDSVKKKL